MRPKGFENPYKDKVDAGCFEYQVFERGADEYERCLKEQDSTFEGKVYDKLGKWVFIEEEISEHI